VSKLCFVTAVAAFAALSVGCGPAPGYEPEPRVPVNYAPVGEGAPAPLTSEELAARQAAGAELGAQPGDIAVGADADEYTDTDPSALTEFKPVLAAHGTWVDDATYGTIWVPAESEVGSDFVPYVTAGHWTYDDTYSWTWVSSYDWGWAPFHYGRWVHIGGRGWAWIPGRQYAGAWVTWRYGSPGYGYVGWSPMAPSWYWYHGVAVGWTFGWTPYYVYCPHDYVYDPYMTRHVVQGPPARAHDANTREYVVASPGVGGNGRVVANPSVGGARAVAQPRVGGPKPNELGIPAEKVVSPPADHNGLARARAFAAPSTAIAQGAAPPLARRRMQPDAVTAPPYGAGRSPAYGSRLDPVARAPQVQGVRPLPPRQAPLPELRPTPRVTAPSAGYTAPGYSPPSVTTVQPPPSYRPSAPSVSPGPSYSSPSFRPSSPSVSPGPSYSSPSFRPSSPSISSSPSFRSSSPSVSSSPSFRSSSPSIRSSPSVSAPRSSPSRSFSAPSVRRR